MSTKLLYSSAVYRECNRAVRCLRIPLAIVKIPSHTCFVQMKVLGYLDSTLETFRYLWIPLGTFGYLWMPFDTFGYLLIPLDMF